MPNVNLAKAKNAKTVTVPKTIKIEGKTFKVVRINKDAFKGAKIRTVTIGANVTTINAYAFRGSKVTKVTIGKNVKKIAAKAFRGSKAAKLTIVLKTKKLTKASTFRNFLKGSKAKTVTVQVKVGTKKQNKTYVKKDKKIFM